MTLQRRASTTALALLAALLLPVATQAALVVVENFDGIGSDGDSLNGVDLGLFSLTAPTGGDVTLREQGGSVDLGSHTPRFSFSTFDITSSARGHMPSPVAIAFEEAASMISIWGGDRFGDLDSWELRVFSDEARSVQVDLAVYPGNDSGNPYQQLVIDLGEGNENIRSAELTWLGADPDPDTGDANGMAWDTLSFRVADQPEPELPEPATALLLGLGLVCVVARRRRAAA